MSLKTIIQELYDFDTTIIANTIGYLDPAPAHEWYMAGTIQSVTPSIAPTVGVAVTCELDSSTPGQSANIDPYWQQVEEMSRLGLPSVWVVKCVGSRPDHECVIGEGMAKVLYTAGCRGVVTDGGVRDVAGLLTVPFAAYSRGKTIHHGPLHFRRPGAAVEVGGITIRPGDIIHANAEGVITIPRGCIEQIVPRATQMRACEQEVHCIWRRTDVTIAEKRRVATDIFRKYGFDTGAAKHELK